MTASCACPLPEDVVHPSGDVLRCGCCGQPLEMTCAGACGTEHIARSFDRSRATLRRAMPPAVRVKETKPRTFAPKPCARCHSTFTPTGGRDVNCQSCKAQAVPIDAHQAVIA